MQSTGAALLLLAAFISLWLQCLALPAAATASPIASPSSAWQQLSQPSLPLPSSSHRTRHSVAAASAPRQLTIWNGQSYSAATFPVDGDSSSPVYAAVTRSPYVVAVHRRDSGADDSRNYTLPGQYMVMELVATTQRVVLRLEAEGQSYSSVHVLDAQHLTLLAAWDTPYPLVFAGINAAGDALLTTVPDSGELVAVHVMTGKRTAVYDGGLSSLQVADAALHPTDGRVVIANGSYPNAINVVVLSADNSVLLSWPVLPPGDHLVAGCSLDLTGRIVTVLVYAKDDERRYFYHQLLQYSLSSGQLRADRTFGSLDYTFSALSPAPYGLAALFLSDFGQLAAVDQDNNVFPLPGVTPILPRPSGLAVLEGPGRNRSVLVSVNVRLAVFELDADGGLIEQLIYEKKTASDQCRNYLDGSLLAVDQRNQIYAELCNGSVAQYDGNTRQLIAVSDVLVSLGFSALTAGPDDSIFFVDMNADSIVRQLQMTTGENRTVVHLPTDQHTVGLAYDHRNNSLWLVTEVGPILQLALGGAVLSNFSCPSSPSPSASRAGRGRCDAIALDLEHNRLVVSYLYIDVEVGFFILWLDMHSGAVVDSQLLPTARNRAALDFSLAVSHDGLTTYVADYETNNIFVYQQQQQ